ncbi:MAG: DUF3866 family protein [Halanaerobiales bacterium]|nr:DUF3866 family protein [Halanaerobiales bacterium]
MYQLALRPGRVKQVLESFEEMTVVEVIIPGEKNSKAINYPKLTGKVAAGDRVILNTTAVELGLGTGGYHFICFNLDQTTEKELLNREDGHILKLRYTPYQLRTRCWEEGDSDDIEKLRRRQNLVGFPVIIIPLHSLLAPLVIVFKTFHPEKRVVYLMTEGGSLPIAFSNQVRQLKEQGLIDSTITSGHAFGGDYETVNIFTGLLTAREQARGDLIIAGIGPGIAGTGSRYGFSGVELAFVNYAINILQGKSIVVPRLGFFDQRQRHYGISHHTITLLEELIDRPVDLPCPFNDIITEQLKETGIAGLHNIYFYPTTEVAAILEKSSFPFHSMGRRLIDDPLFFYTAGLACYRWEELMKE